MPTTPGTTGTPLNPQETLKKFAGLITEIGEEPPATSEPAAEPETSPAPTPPAPSPQSADQEPPASEADSQEFDVVVDGETETVPLSELKRGYSREADYTRKTQALARERESLRATVEAEAQAQVQAERLQLLQGLAQVGEALEKLQGEPDWGQLHKELEPGEFLKRKADWEASKANLERIRAHEAQVAQDAQRAQAEQFQQYRRGEQDKLLAAIPEWADAEKAKPEHAKLLGAAKAYGYTEQEILQVVDHRALLVLRDAMRYRELHREPGPQAKVKTAGIKTAKPGTPERPRPNAEYLKKVERAQKSGRQRDAMDAIADLLPD